MNSMASIEWVPQRSFTILHTQDDELLCSLVSLPPGNLEYNTYTYTIISYLYIYNYINHIMYRSIYDFYIYHIYIWYGTWSMPQRLNPSPSWGLATLTCHSKMTFVRENHRYKTVEMGESIGNISYIYISYILLGDHKIGILFPASFPRNGTIDVN
jgi:hypothetical protein